MHVHFPYIVVHFLLKRKYNLKIDNSENLNNIWEFYAKYNIRDTNTCLHIGSDCSDAAYVAPKQPVENVKKKLDLER